MISFLDRQRRSHAPPFLVGGRDLTQRLSDEGTLWACGDPLTLSCTAAWCVISDDYHVAGPVDSVDDYRRLNTWASPVCVSDLTGREWSIPKILDANGARAFSVNYGADFLPSLSPEQYRITDIANAARDALVASASGTQDIEMHLAARWTAELLAVMYHLPVDAIASLRIIDDAMIIGALQAATGINCEVVR